MMKLLQMKRIAGVVWLALGCLAMAETEIRIEGLRSTSESEVLSAISGRLVYVRQKPPSAWRANDAAFLVEQLLINDGYQEVIVSGRVAGPNRIDLSVQEGVRFSLGKVEIRGHENVKDMEKIFKAPFSANRRLGAGRVPYREVDLEKGLDYVARFLKSQGYWNATVEISGKEVDMKTGEVDLVLQLDEGVRFQIGAPVVRSVDGRGVKRAEETAQPFIGQWATTENITKLKQSMVEAFTSRGYPNATIYMTQRLGKSLYFPEFGIDLGTRVKLLKVHSKGLERTKPDRLAEIMAPLEGDWYDEAAMNKKVRQLLATGAFDLVRVETEEVANKRIDATLHFEEAKAKEVTLSAGLESFNGPVFRATYTDRNFKGKLRAFSAGIELSGRGALGEVKLSDPWWRGTDIFNEIRLYSLVKTFEGYTGYESGLQSTWKWDFSERHSISVLLGGSFVTVSAEELPLALLGQADYVHLHLAVIQKWDYRDNPVLPKDGWHVEVPVRIGAAIGDETDAYLKLGAEGGWYHMFNANWHLGIGGFAEFVLPGNELSDLPVDLRLFNGGARSVRSFPERELGPSFAGDPFGGDFSWAVNTELSRNISGPLRALVFLDAGAVTGDYIPPRGGGLELAAGLGLRLDLPIGPVRLEYGHSLTQDDGEPSGTWHFAIGTTF